MLDQTLALYENPAGSESRGKTAGKKFNMFSAFHRWARGRATTEHAQRRGTVVIQPLPGIGDMVWHIPHIHDIARSEGRVTLLTKRRSSAERLFAADPHVESILWLIGIRGDMRPPGNDVLGARFTRGPFAEVSICTAARAMASPLCLRAFPGVSVMGGAGKGSSSRIRFAYLKPSATPTPSPWPID